MGSKRRLSQTRALRVLKEVAEALNSASTEQQAAGLRVVDAILSGTHEPNGSHYQVLRAFMDDATLAEASAALETMGYRTHEFGDSVLIERTIAAATLLSWGSCRSLWLQPCPA